MFSLKSLSLRKIFSRSILCLYLFSLFVPVLDAKDSKDKKQQSFLPPIAGNVQTINIPVVPDKNFIGIGISEEHTAWLTIPRNIELVGSLKLVYFLSHSNTLAPNSTATILFNDEPLQSFNLTNENAKKTAYEVDIPFRLIRKGANALTFRFYAIANILYPCQDLSNPANWTVIHQDSYLQVAYRPVGINTLNFFPEPYVNMGVMNKYPLGIVLPLNPSFEELRSAAVLVQYLGLEDKFSYSKIETFLGSVPTEVLDKYNLISIGSLDRNVFRDELTRNVPAEALGKLGSKNGVVAQIESPSKKGRALIIISGANPETLYITAQSLTSPSLVKQMKQFYDIIDTSEPLPPYKSTLEKTNPTFKDLGYFPVKLSGIFETSAAFQYTRPPHWELLEGTGLVLELAYSPLLEPNSSILSVVINDKPVQSFKLSGGKSRGSFSMELPEDILDDPSFYIVVTATMSVEQARDKEQWCLDPNYDKAWTIIRDSSFFYTPHAQTEQRDFQAFPAVFLSEQGLRPLKIIIPDQPTLNDYNAAFNMIYMIASLMPYDTNPHFEILKVSEVTKEIREQYDLILLGSLESNPLISEVNNRLPLPIDPLTGRPSQTKIEILPQFLEDTAALELAVSPWNAKRNMLVIGSEYDYLVQQATIMLLNRTVSSQWKGNITLINDKDQWYSYNYGAGEAKKRKRGGNFYFYLWLLCVVVLLVIVGMIFYWRRKYGFRDPFSEK